MIYEYHLICKGAGKIRLLITYGRYYLQVFISRTKSVSIPVQLCHRFIELF